MKLCGLLVKFFCLTFHTWPIQHGTVFQPVSTIGGRLTQKGALTSAYRTAFKVNRALNKENGKNLLLGNLEVVTLQ